MLETVEEKVYKSLLDLDLDWYVKCADVLPPETATRIMHQAHVSGWYSFVLGSKLIILISLKGFFPNTYTMTKFMAEQLVEEYRERFGLSALIVRPSIVTPSLQEPFPGWLDSYAGLNGSLMAIALGTVACVPFNPNAIVDMIPLDIVCNYIIVAAWFDTAKP